jgi:hypothetical protein
MDHHTQHTMKLTQVTFEAMQAAGIDTNAYTNCLGTAQKKKAEGEHKVTQGKDSYKQVERSEITKLHLTEAEDYAMMILAFDSNQSSACKKWSKFSWTLPVDLVVAAQAYWPYVSKSSDKQEAKPAISQADAVKSAQVK